MVVPRANRAAAPTFKPFNCARWSNVFCLLHVVPPTLRPPPWLRDKATEFSYWELVNWICGWNSPNQFWLLSLEEMWKTWNWCCVKTLQTAEQRLHTEGLRALQSPGSSCRSCQGRRWSPSGGRGISLYLNDLLKGLFLWAAGLTALKFHHMLSKGCVFEAAVCLLRGLPGGTWPCHPCTRMSAEIVASFICKVFPTSCPQARSQMTSASLTWWLRSPSLTLFKCSKEETRHALRWFYFFGFLLIKETLNITDCYPPVGACGFSNSRGRKAWCLLDSGQT